MRLTFAVDSECKGLEKALCTYFKAIGAERKVGPSPRGALEREASRLLEKLRVGKKRKDGRKGKKDGGPGVVG